MAGVDQQIRVLASAWGLDIRQASQLTGFASILAGDPLAPTTVRAPEAVLRDHLADTLVAIERTELRDARVIADIGAGAGVPGIVLAVALPDAELRLLEASSRKCEFMRRVVGDLGLSNVEVLHRRAEAWSDGLQRCDAVTARALAPLDVVLEYAAPLLRIGGSLIAWRGARDEAVELAGARAASILGFASGVIYPVKPYPEAENRFLHIFRKVGSTPDRFPRRDGMARKRPLGSV